MAGARRSIARAAVVALLAAAAAAPAAASAPAVVITSPADGSASSDPTPWFTGTAEEAGGPVDLAVYRGVVAEGSPVVTAQAFLIPFGKWSIAPVAQLPDGTYTARATQQNAFLETGVSAPVTFTIETAPPVVTLTAPPSPSDDATPVFTGTASDTGPVRVQIHAGGSAAGAIVATATAAGTGAGWTSDPASPALAPGQYTAVALQQSSVPPGLPGSSEPVTFVVVAPVPPTAAFRWLPSEPHSGEPVTLFSTSSDAASPIAAFAWSLAGNSVFTGGEPAVTTSFALPGPHVVQLRVTAADGLSSVAAETIYVTPRPPSLMQPFPVVRIAGTWTSAGTRLSLLSVLAPAGATVRVSCHGGGCPAHTQRLLALPRHGAAKGSLTVTFHRFERLLRPRAVLEVRVYAPGEIGKLTRLRIRRGRPPGRLDTCLDPSGSVPLACSA